MRRFLFTRSQLAAGVCCTALLLSSACSRTAAQKSADRAALTVTVVTPASSVWAERIAASGTVAAWQESIIGAEVNALKLEEMLAEVGDSVRKGQVLARFNDETVRAELAQTEAAVAMAEANLALAQDQVERARRLDGSGTISRETALQFEVSLKTSTAQLASSKAQLSAQRLRLQRTQVVSPDDGLISSRSATVGSVLSPGVELFRLIRQGRLEWRAEIPLEHISKINPGMEATLLPAGRPPITGRVRIVSPKIEATSGIGIVYVDIPPTDHLLAGTYAVGGIQLAESPATHVPESALVYRDGYTYLMKVEADSTVRQIKISTGRRQGTTVEILNGVGPADKIVATGGSFLSDGDTVRIVTATPATAAVQGGSR